MAEKKVDAVYKKNWSSLIGSLEGALSLLDSNQKTAFLMGGTGFGFRINLESKLNPSANTFPWGDGLGYSINRYGYAYRSLRSSPRLAVYDVYKAQGHELILKGIETGKASVVWNIHGSEFGLVNGFDDEKKVYFVSGFLDGDEGEKELVWDDLGKGDYSTLAVYQPTAKICDFNTPEASRSAIYYGVRHAQGRASCFRDCHIGLEAFDYWADAVKSDDIDPRGASYNAHQLAEARGYLPDYLEEVGSHFDETAIEEAVAKYKEVAHRLKQVADLFPYSRTEVELPSSDDRNKASGLIKEAGGFEKEAVQALQKALDKSE